MSVYMCMHVCVCMYWRQSAFHGMHVKGRGQLRELSFLLPSLHGFQGPKSNQACTANVVCGAVIHPHLMTISKVPVLPLIEVYIPQK